MKAPQTLETQLNAVYAAFEEADLYYGHGTDNPWDEACALVLSVMGLPLDSGDSVLGLEVSPEQQQRIESIVKKRVEERTPLPYLLNEAWFYGMPFYVDERVLVPRSPIAEWIEKRFAPWLSSDKPPARILDLCTGSGCIAIALAKTFPNAIIDASDISKEALSVAKINVEKHGMQDRVNLIASDVFDQIDQTYDLIVSNPPYVDQHDIDTMPEEYAHEPVLGLAAGEEGLLIVDRIFSDYPRVLNPNGMLVVEVGNSDTAVDKHYPNLPITWLECEFGGGGIFLLTRDDS